jgi:four helix bundle protein
MRNFKKYDVSQLVHPFVLNIYEVTRSFSKEERYGITSQLRRASVSVPTNFSEGCGRSSDVQFFRFIHIAQGSGHESELLLELSFDLKYINLEVFEKLNTEINTIKRKMYSLEQKIKA